MQVAIIMLIMVLTMHVFSDKQLSINCTSSNINVNHGMNYISSNNNNVNHGISYASSNNNVNYGINYAFIYR